MALADTYRQFLLMPDTSALADNAALYYITTTTSFKGATSILKHMANSAKQVKKSKEEVLTTIQDHRTVAIEINTTLEFLTNGAAYAPGLDDNFLTDRAVNIPIMHIVSFNNDAKIVQIRQSWDQGSLLKQLDVIGKTGRNWPIRDSNEQAKMVERCTKELISAQDPQGLAIRRRDNTSNTQSSASLFNPGEDEEVPARTVISPRGGMRPQQRGFEDILGDNPMGVDAQYAESPSKSAKASLRPQQRNFDEIFGDEPSSPGAESHSFAPKIGAGKNFQPSRLFDAEEDVDAGDGTEVAPQNQLKRHDPKKYQHFEFADGSDPQDAPARGDAEAKRTKHSSQWDFEDFVTPQKFKPSKVLRQQDVRHWGTEEDDYQESPVRKPAAARPRRDVEPHFEFMDDGNSPSEPRVTRPRGATHNKGLGLYENNLYTEDGTGEALDAEDAHALGNITNLKDRSRDFAPHFTMTDDAQTPEPQQKIGDDRKKAVKMMDANWSAYDSSPVASKENQQSAHRGTSKEPDERGIRVGGDGMGGAKGSNRDWFFGGADDDTPKPARKKQAEPAKAGGFNWDF